MGVCVSVEAAGVLIAGIGSASVPLAERQSELKEHSKLKKEQAEANRKAKQGSRLAELERLEGLRDERIEESGYKKKDKEKNDAWKKPTPIVYNPKTDTATGLPAGFPISLHNGRRGSNTMDWSHAKGDMSVSTPKSKKNTPRNSRVGSDASVNADGKSDGGGSKNRQTWDLNKPEGAGYEPPGYAPRGGPKGPKATYSAAVVNNVEASKEWMRASSTERTPERKDRKGSDIVRFEKEPVSFDRERSRSYEDIPTLGRQESEGWGGRLRGVGGKDFAKNLDFLNDPKKEAAIKRQAAIAANARDRSFER